MQRFTLRLLTFVCVTSAAVVAQTTTTTMPHAMTSFGAGVVVPSFLPPAPPAMDPVSYWSAVLGLNTVQRASLKTILSDQQSAMNVLRPGLQQAHSSLRSAAQAAGSDAEIDGLAASLGSVYAQAVAAQAKAYAKFYGLLTAAQQQQLDSLTTGGAGGGVSIMSSDAGPVTSVSASNE